MPGKYILCYTVLCYLKTPQGGLCLEWRSGDEVVVTAVCGLSANQLLGQLAFVVSGHQISDFPLVT